MTRRDYEAIARAIKDVNRQQGGEEAIADVVSNLAHIMRQDNPRFDAGRFLKACGVAS